MNTETRGMAALARPFRLLAAAAVAAALTAAPPASAAVEYVKICSLYGARFFYDPGTDTCVNIDTGEARQQTEGGTWRWLVPNNPRRWVSSPSEGCPVGQLVKLGDITASDLSLNIYQRFETNTHLRLVDGKYISAVMYKGGFSRLPSLLVSELPACPSPNAQVRDATDESCTPGDAPVGGGSGACEVQCVGGAWQFAAGPAQYAVSTLPTCPSVNAVVTDATDPACTFGDAPVGGGATTCDVHCDGLDWAFGGSRNFGSIARNGNFCMYYYYYEPTQSAYLYVPFGCIDTQPLADVPATLVFVPDKPIPPLAPSLTDVLGASGDRAGTVYPEDIQGQLSIWLCLRDAPSSSSGDTRSPDTRSR